MGEKSYSLNDLIESLIFKASKDGVITEDEQSLINQIQVDLQNLTESIEKANENEETMSAIEKIFKSSTTQMVQNAISIARRDTTLSADEKEIIDELFRQLGWNFKDWKTRNWFVFKVCIYLDEQTDVRKMLDGFDKVFCMWNLSSFQMKSGLCLGTKHYVIDDNDVTLLAFGLHTHNARPWVRKGAFAFLEFENQDKFIKDLRLTAERLHLEFMEKNQERLLQNSLR
ncbi:MAG: TerB family tellurite resistance protein [Candidatus Heimdallarchaeota archaeon]|nr:TerB family tellurite resistance protein [Candidatus Heimdallarchaeota archaeon]